MRIVADTSVLLRLVIRDSAAQQKAAADVFQEAEVVAIGIHVLCELVWVLSHHYGVARVDIAATIRKFIDRHNVVTNRPAADAGLHVLEAGGDFADGAIAYEGRWLGADTFVSFDRKAVRLLAAQGRSAQLLG